MSLPAFVVATAVTVLVAHLLMRLFGRRYAGPDRAVRRLRRDLLVGSLLSLAGWAVALVAAGGAVHPTVRATVAGPELLLGLLTAYGYAVGGTVVVLGAYLGYLPAIRRTRAVDVGYATAIARVGRWLLVAGLLAATVAGVVASVSLTPLSAAVAVAVLVALAYLASPWLIAVSQSVRDPTGDERERLAQLAARAGADGHRLRVLERHEEETAAAFVRGPPGARHLFVTDHLLDALDDDAVAAVLAVSVATARHTAYRLAVVAVVGGALVVALVAGRPLVGVGTLVAAPVPAYLGGRRLVFRGDARAADRVGAGTTADALERVAELHGASLDAGVLARLFALRPAVGTRIDRLRAAERGAD